jgi:hypothetical protein
MKNVAAKQQAIRKARDVVARYINENGDPVALLLAERREDAARDDGEEVSDSFKSRV